MLLEVRKVAAIVGRVVTEGTEGASWALVMFSVLWVLVAWVCPVWGNSGSRPITVCALVCLGASIKVLRIVNIY